MSEPTEPEDYTNPNDMDTGTYMEKHIDNVRFCPWCGNETFHHGYDLDMDVGHGYCYCTFCEFGVWFE